MASSIHIEQVSTGSFLHNDRTMKVSYLIDTSDNNECTATATEAFKQFQSLKDEATKNYTERTNQKMQKSTVFLKEAIVNLEEHHTLKDLEPIIKKLESYGFTILQASIHRDEGFVNDENEKKKNYHAHITMFNLNAETGKTVKFGKDYRTELSKLQTLTADALKMTRGKVSVKEHADELNVEVEKATKRLGTHEYKHAMKIKERAEEKVFQQGVEFIAEEREKVEYNYKDFSDRIVALTNQSAEERKELHRLNSIVKKDTSRIEELEIKISAKERELKSETQFSDDLRKDLAIKTQELKELRAKAPEQVEVEKIVVDETALNKALQATKQLQTDKDTLQSDLRAKESEIINLKSEVKELQAREPERVEVEKIVVDDLALNKALQDTKEVQTKNVSLESDLKALKQDMTILSTKNDRLETDVKTAKAEFIDYKKSEATNSSRLHDSYRDLQNDLVQEENKVEWLETELESKNKALQATKPLIAENVSLKQEKIVLERDMSVLSTKNAELETENKTLKQNYEDMRTTVKEIYHSLKLKGTESWEQGIGQIKEKISFLVKKDEIAAEPVQSKEAEILKELREDISKAEKADPWQAAKNAAYLAGLKDKKPEAKSEAKAEQSYQQKR